MFRNRFLIICLNLFVYISFSLPGSVNIDRNNPAFQNLEKSFLCVDGCGMALEDCSNQTAEQMRLDIMIFLDQGLSEFEIKRYMVNIYGNEILREPPKSGFNLIVWTAPYLAILIGFVIIFIAVNKWLFFLKINKTDKSISYEEEGDVKIYSSLIDEERKKYF